MNLPSFLRDFLAERNLDVPDARPLYAYRCTAEEFKTCRLAIQERIASTGGYRLPENTAQAFCLYAAEWWRRNHEGGAWKWEGILADCGFADTPLQALYSDVQSGLDRWRRPLLRDGRGRIFLVTLACEGGLPLKLVQKEGAALRRFFRSLIENYQTFASSEMSTTSMAEVVQRHLPASLRQTVVFELGGKVAKAVWDLQDQLGETGDPIRDLDKNRPDWREDFPFEIEDETASALLTRLIQDASEIKRRRPPRFRAVRRLVEKPGSGWELETEIVCPDLAFAGQLESLFSVEASSFPPRFHLFVETDGEQKERLAIATEIYGERERAFRLEQVSREFKMRGVDAALALSLMAEVAGEVIGPAAFSGSTELGDLPWTFVEDESRGHRLIGQGSVQVRQDSCVVLSRPEFQFTGPGEHLQLGRLTHPDREIRRVEGSVQVSWEGVACSIRTRAPEALAFDYQLVGRGLPLVSGKTKIFSGRPRLEAIPTEGEAITRVVAQSEIQWRPRARSATWAPYGEDCVGDVKIRAMKDGDLLFETPATVLPRGGKVVLEPGKTGADGVIRIRGMDAAQLSAEAVGARSCEVIGDRDEWQISVNADREPPATVGVTLQWTGGRSSRINLPYPARDARFLGRKESVLTVDARVSLEGLSDLRAVALTVDPSERFHVEASLSAEDVPPQRDLRVWRDLKPTQEGPHELEMRFLREPLRQLFSASTDLDAQARMLIESPTGSSLRPRPLQVSRFGAEFILDKAGGRVKLDPCNSEALSPEDVQCEAVRLWDLSSDPEVLPILGDGSGWAFSVEEREAGPWLVLGWKGNDCRVRPAPWTVWGDEVDDSDTATEFDCLQRAILRYRPETGLDEMRAALENVAEAPLHEAWIKTIDPLVQFLGAVPPATFPIAKLLVESPRSAVLALLRASSRERTFETAWGSLEGLPFLWCMVPVKSWLTTTFDYVEAVERELAAVADRDSRVREMLSTLVDVAPRAEHRTFLDPISLLVKAIIFSDNEALENLIAVQTTTGRGELDAMLKAEKQDLFQRSGDRKWPPSDALVRWVFRNLDPSTPSAAAAFQITQGVPGHKRAVLSAPVAVAYSSASGIELPRDLVHDVKFLRSYDERWFDRSLYSLFHLFIEDQEILQEFLDA